MSSKILTPDQQPESTHRVSWRKVGAAAGQPSAHLHSNGTPDTAVRFVLEEQVGKRERESEARERIAGDLGFQAGEAAARKQAAQQIEQMMTRVAESLEEMLSMRRQMRRQMEMDLVRLAVVVARRILHRELSVDPEALSGVVRAAVSKIELKELHRLRLHSSDAEVLRTMLAGLHLPERVEVVADASLERGSVILETAQGILDSSVHVQLEEIESGFTDMVRRTS